jgi:hypothetical protein
MNAPLICVFFCLFISEGLADEDFEHIDHSACVAVILQTVYTHEAQKMHAMLSKQEDDDAHFTEDKGANAEADMREPLFFMRQLTSSVAAIVAVIHSLGNNLTKEPLDTICMPNTPVRTWLGDAEKKSPFERGLMLADATELLGICDELSEQHDYQVEDLAMQKEMNSEMARGKTCKTALLKETSLNKDAAKGPSMARAASEFFAPSLAKLKEDMVQAQELDLHEQSHFDDADFSCFLPAKCKQGYTTLCELDGVKSAPVDLGPMMAGQDHGGHDADLLLAVADEVRERSLAFSISEIENCTPPKQTLLALVNIGAPKVFC